LLRRIARPNQDSLRVGGIHIERPCQAVVLKSSLPEKVATFQAREEQLFTAEVAEVRRGKTEDPQQEEGTVAKSSEKTRVVGRRVVNHV
jgi:hypothetical protein